MIKAAKIYVRYMDATSRVVGKVVMFLIFGMIGILLYEAVSRTIFNRPHIWSVESAQFVMAAYYLLGGGYSLLIGSHVRMDLLYDHWSAKGKAVADVITFFVALLYLVVLTYGGFQGILYAVKYKQVTYSAWAPQVAPIKIIMQIGIVMMILQLIAEFIKDLAIIRGENIYE
jgi:TRAP-type mannitol/chloroaromatic compound transport system permease small subunit